MPQDLNEKNVSKKNSKYTKRLLKLFLLQINF